MSALTLGRVSSPPEQRRPSDSTVRGLKDTRHAAQELAWGQLAVGLSRTGFSWPGPAVEAADVAAGCVRTRGVVFAC